MEIQPSRVLTTPSAANLMPVWVTVQVKRRKLGSRVIRHFSVEITGVLCDDAVCFAEINTYIYRNSEILYGTAAL